MRRDNRIKTIQASLAIENNSLSLDQVTAIINRKRILGPGQDIREVQNAYEAYEKLMELNPFHVDSLLMAHQVLKLIEVMGTESLSTMELMDLVAIKHRPTFRDNYQLPAIELGYIEMTIPDKPRSSKQKYRKIKG